MGHDDDIARAAAFERCLGRAIPYLHSALELVHDQVFGVPRWALEDLNDIFKRYGLEVRVKSRAS